MIEYIRYLAFFLSGAVVGLLILFIANKRQVRQWKNKIEDLRAEVWEANAEIIELQKSHGRLLESVDQ